MALRGDTSKRAGSGGNIVQALSLAYNRTKGGGGSGKLVTS